MTETPTQTLQDLNELYKLMGARFGATNILLFQLNVAQAGLLNKNNLADPVAPPQNDVAENRFINLMNRRAMALSASYPADKQGMWGNRSQTAYEVLAEDAYARVKAHTAGLPPQEKYNINAKAYELISRISPDRFFKNENQIVPTRLQNVIDKSLVSGIAVRQIAGFDPSISREEYERREAAVKSLQASQRVVAASSPKDIAPELSEGKKPLSPAPVVAAAEGASANDKTMLESIGDTIVDVAGETGQVLANLSKTAAVNIEKTRIALWDAAAVGMEKVEEGGTALWDTQKAFTAKLDQAIAEENAARLASGNTDQPAARSWIPFAGLLTGQKKADERQVAATEPKNEMVIRVKSAPAELTTASLPSGDAGENLFNAIELDKRSTTYLQLASLPMPNPQPQPQPQQGWIPHIEHTVKSTDTLSALADRNGLIPKLEKGATRAQRNKAIETAVNKIIEFNNARNKYQITDADHIVDGAKIYIPNKASLSLDRGEIIAAVEPGQRESGKVPEKSNVFSTLTSLPFPLDKVSFDPDKSHLNEFASSPGKPVVLLSPGHELYKNPNPKAKDEEKILADNGPTVVVLGEMRNGKPFIHTIYHETDAKGWADVKASRAKAVSELPKLKEKFPNAALYEVQEAHLNNYAVGFRIAAYEQAGLKVVVPPTYEPNFKYNTIGDFGKNRLAIYKENQEKGLNWPYIADSKFTSAIELAEAQGRPVVFSSLHANVDTQTREELAKGKSRTGQVLIVPKGQVAGGVNDTFTSEIATAMGASIHKSDRVEKMFKLAISSDRKVNFCNEIAFMTNPADLTNMMDPDWQAAAAKREAGAIVGALNGLAKNPQYANIWKPALPSFPGTMIAESVPEQSNPLSPWKTAVVATVLPKPPLPALPVINSGSDTPNRNEKVNIAALTTPVNQSSIPGVETIGNFITNIPKSLGLKNPNEPIGLSLK